MNNRTEAFDYIFYSLTHIFFFFRIHYFSMETILQVYMYVFVFAGISVNMLREALWYVCCCTL